MRRVMRSLLAALLITTAAAWHFQAQEVSAPAADALRFAVIGDNGTGDRFEYEVAQQMVASRQRFPFELVLMLGDNIYGGQSPKDFVQKFEAPYRPLLEAGVRFYASLGNHDSQSNRLYQPFNMDGERYYTFARKNVRFFVLDSDYVDAKQLAWVDGALRSASDEWKICYFHHPLYSDGGRHGSQVDLRVLLEPIFVKHGVNVVFSGHDHVYERLTPQRGIQYFVSGAAGQVRKGDLRRSGMTAAAFDQDQSFMLVQIAGSELSFQAISRTGIVVDSGVLHREPRP
jgi:3',5'-cyclic AMP phosphodiesterase CpdA